MANVGNPMMIEKKKAKENASESVKAALLISGVDRNRFGKPKDEPANNYLLGTDQYPDTFEKAMRILENYQVTRPSRQFRGDRSKSGLAFLQQGGRGQGRGGRGGGAGRAEPTGAGAGGGEGDANTTSGASRDSASQASQRTNQAGDSHCCNCGKMDHWAYKCPDLTAEQQAQLHMHI